MEHRHQPKDLEDHPPDRPEDHLMGQTQAGEHLPPEGQTQQVEHLPEAEHQAEDHQDQEHQEAEALQTEAHLQVATHPPWGERTAIRTHH